MLLRGVPDILFLTATATIVSALRYDLAQSAYNLNQNESAVNPLDYWGEWDNHTYYPSPWNWRFPFYSFFLDRFVNGDPTNDNANGTLFEQDVMQNQLRHGGDLRGFVDSLDYIQGMGIRVRVARFLTSPWVVLPLILSVM
jgi:alpha-1,3-glucan synthase